MRKRYTANEALEVINAHLNEELIYNVDYNDLKETVNRSFEDDLKKNKVENYYNFCHSHDNVPWLDTPMYPHELNAFSKRVEKFAKDVGHLDGADEVLSGFRQLIEDWKPVADGMKALKPFIVKGRKPSNDPNKTPERTLENTGTCGVCGQNVKMHNGRLVDHGFDIRFGFRNGKCFGVGYEPVEISKKVLVDYLTHLGHIRNDVYDNLNKFRYEKPDLTVRVRGGFKTLTVEDNDYERARQVEVRQLESKLRMIDQMVVTYNTQIEQWEPRQLPGETENV